METLTVAAPWTRTQKVLFRFSFCYVLLYVFLDGMLSVIFHALPFSAPWDSFIYWIGDAVLNIGYEMPEKPNGSGDTTYNYVQLLAILFVAVMATTVWSAVDRERTNYARLAEGLRIFVAVYVGLIMLMYGLAKVFKTQFPYPGEARLAQTYGDSSPMGLLWTFMGYSYPYNFFAGMGEVVGGILLMFRRTTLLGALVVIGVMSNVVVLNFSYDVPVKIYSSHLLLFAFLVAAPNVSRLYKFFITNEPVEVEKIQPFSIDTNLSMGLTMLRGVALLTVFAVTVGGVINVSKRTAAAKFETDAVLEGLYETIEFNASSDAYPLRWTRLKVMKHGSAVVSTADGSDEEVSFNPDTTNKTIAVYAFADSLMSSTLMYEELNDSTLFISGLYKQDSIEVKLRAQAQKNSLLMERGFHWINEQPFHR
ncbi:MAG: hypothetical protein AAF564_00035 [Bacteroidota bacterium]